MPRIETRECRVYSGRYRKIYSDSVIDVEQLHCAEGGFGRRTQGPKHELVATPANEARVCRRCGLTESLLRLEERQYRERRASH